jgi:hypothetical protein
MNDKNESGASYLASLRQPATSPAATARAKEVVPGEIQSTDLPHATGVVVPEKRKSPRYRCNGSARLQEIGGATSTWATFTDISMHGCYIESTAPFRVGTLLDLKLDAGGVHISTRGEVRVSYPGVGMGISLASMSDADRNQLRQWLATIPPRSSMLGPGGPSNFSNQPNAAAQSEAPPLLNASATLRAVEKFFESRQMMGRDDFLRILRNTR